MWVLIQIHSKSDRYLPPFDGRLSSNSGDVRCKGQEHYTEELFKIVGLKYIQHTTIFIRYQNVLNDQTTYYCEQLILVAKVDGLTNPENLLHLIQTKVFVAFCVEKTRFFPPSIWWYCLTVCDNSRVNEFITAFFSFISLQSLSHLVIKESNTFLKRKIAFSQLSTLFICITYERYINKIMTMQT